MKSILTSLLFAVLFIAVSCKKDKESGVAQLNGDYNIYLKIVEDPNDGPIEYPMPSADGGHGKLVVKANQDSSMSVNILQFNKNNDTLSKTTITGRVKTLTNGDLRFVNGSNWLGTFGKNNELEVYASATITWFGRK